MIKANEDNLYIIRSFCGNGESIIKFGFSNTIKKRIAQYKAHNPNIEIVGTYYHKDGILFERKVHSLIKSELGREWYSEDKLPILLNYIENKINNIKFRVNEMDDLGFMNVYDVDDLGFMHLVDRVDIYGLPVELSIDELEDLKLKLTLGEITFQYVLINYHIPGEQLDYLEKHYESEWPILVAENNERRKKQFEEYIKNNPL